jgi:nitrate/nitrite transporter NarK
MIGHVSVWQGLRQRNVLFLALALCLANVEGYAFVFWLPTTIHRVSGLSVISSTMWSATFFTLSALPGQSFPMVLSWLCLTTACGYSFPAPFWVLPTLTLGESAAAASIGLINLIGNLGGFIGPSAVGYVLARTHSYPLGMMILALGAMLGGLVLLAVRVQPQPSQDTVSTCRADSA